MILPLLHLVPLFLGGDDSILTDDAHTVVNAPSANYGKAAALTLASTPSDKVYIKFSVRGLPANTTGSQVEVAALVFFVSQVSAAGTFDVLQITSDWNERYITDATAPSTGAVIASGVSVTAVDQLKFVRVDMTNLVKAWVDGTQPNYGIALVPSASSTIAISIDSKENPKTAHEASLHIELAGAQGPQGIQGPQGPQGVKGDTGATGQQGPVGNTGPQGQAGVAGATGPQGPIGNTGTQGVQGPIGASPFTLNGNNAVFTQGSLGIGTTTPTADLQISGLNGFLATGTFGQGNLAATGAGTRMLWYPNKAAFRVGYTSGGNWDDSNIGIYSVAMGQDTLASGNDSVAMGLSTTASGDICTAMGSYTTASGLYSTAMGSGTIASGDFSTAMGDNTWASGADGSTAMGVNTTASGADGSTAMGYGTAAGGIVSTAMGYTTSASGEASTALGWGTKAQNWQSTAMGAYNIGGAAVGPNGYDSFDPLFEIGNGTSDSQRHDAFAVLHNGWVLVGVDPSPGSPAGFLLEVGGSAGKPGGGSWSNSSDIRLKKNIQELEDPLTTVLALHGVSFEYKDPKAIHELPGTRIGFIAQEVEKVIPDWIDEVGGYKRITIRGFEALAVESFRELHRENEQLKTSCAELKAANEELRARLDRLEETMSALSRGK
ncbi:MAG: DNRLRE domain-containing protein [Planctomycetes bacterium]|nr:DNRLRE domain-containing protein [Planctomycetota bacterium]